MKITGMIMLFLATVLTGYYLTSRAKRRIDAVDRCIELIRKIKTDISYSAKGLYDILREAKESELLNKTVNLGLLETAENDFALLWKRLIENDPIFSALNKKEAYLIISFGQKLGKTDCAHQIMMCDEYLKSLEEIGGLLKGKKDETVKLYKTASLVLGLVEIVMLL